MHGELDDGQTTGLSMFSQHRVVSLQRAPPHLSALAVAACCIGCDDTANFPIGWSGRSLPA